MQSKRFILYGFKTLRLFLLILTLSALPAFAAKRVALVIGNGAYAESPLKNPVNDATDMAATLRSLGFEVIHKTNAKKPTMLKAINQFGEKLRSAKVGLFYYAGHGMQVKGSNFLIPIGAYVNSETDVEYEGVNAGRILGKMETAANKINIIILDACRNNPFKRSFRSSSRGLARMDAPQGTFIAYATSPGSVAADGNGRNGIFTKHLLKNMVEPGLPIERVLKKVRAGVLRDTGKQQMPWQSSSLTGEFFFASSAAIKDSPAPPPDDTKKTGRATLSVESNVTGAEVLLDGRSIGSTNLPDVAVTAGEHRIAVQKEGYQTYRRKLNVNKGRSVSIYVDLSRAAPQNGNLYVDTQPEGAQVKILNINPVFQQGMALPPGRYHVSVSKDGYETKALWVNLDAGEDKRLDISLEKIASSAAGGKTRTFTVGGVSFDMIRIPAGTFTMGSPGSEGERDDDETQHRVTLTRDYYLGETEVTQDLWQAVMGNNPSAFSGCGNCPVEQVSWDDCQTFIRKLNQQTGTRFRLPTEAEWEYAARAGTTTPFNTGNCLSTSAANYDGNYPYSGCSKGTYRKKTMTVKSFTPNAYGLYDMHGNVWEWCQDWYGDYSSGSVSDPTGPSNGSRRVFRGGSWNLVARNCRSAIRYRNSPDYRSSYLGFRLVLPPGQR